MNRVIIMIAITASIFSAVTAFGESAYIGGNIGIGLANDNVEEGLALNGYLELDAAPNLALRGTALIYGGDATVDILSDGDFTMFGTEASVILKLPSNGVTPYIGGGVGYYFPDNELSDEVNDALASVGVRGEDDLQSGAGIHAMAGVAIEIGKNVAIDLNVKYVYFNTDDEAKVTSLTSFRTETNTQEVDLSTLFATVGLKIGF